MIFRFKNGYQVQIRDCEGKSRKELIEIAKKAVKDAVTLEKRIDTNTSFMPTKMKEAIADKDEAKYDKELRFLIRDLATDADTTHATGYPKTYRKEVLEKLIAQYDAAYQLVVKADKVFNRDDALLVGTYLDGIKENWKIDNMKPYTRIEYDNGEVTIKYTPTVEAAYDDIIRRIDAGHRDGNEVAMADIINDVTGEVLKEVYRKNKTPVKNKVKDAEDEDIKDASDNAYRKVQTILGKNPQLKGKINRDEFDTGEIMIDFDDYQNADKFVIECKRAGLKCREGYFGADITILVRDAEQSRDSVKDAEDEDTEDAPAKYRMLIDFADHDFEYRAFDDLKKAVNYIYSVMRDREGTKSELSTASVYDGNDNWLVTITPEDYRTNPKFLKNLDVLFEDAKKVKDAPPPYYDPTDYPQIKSDYSTERLSREARHQGTKPPLLDDLDAVYKEIDELIAKGTNALVTAGWSKDDARRAIATRYIALEKDLRKGGLGDEARELHKKIRALEKAWDLRV